MTITAIFIFSIIISVAVFDIVIIAKKGKQESISAYVIRASYKYPLLVLITGIVLGHLFWSMKTQDWNPNIKCVEVKSGQD